MDDEQNPFFNKKITIRKPGSGFVNTLQFFAILLIVLVVGYIFVVTPNQVDGLSMFPTFNNDEILLTNRIPQWIGTTSFGAQWDYQRGDIVIMKLPNHDKEIVKRVIGIPGDTIELVDGRVVRNGEVISESYLTPELYTDYGDLLIEGAGLTVAPGNLLVMGDNRTGSNSLDSRFIELGPVERQYIIGKVIARIWPLENFQLIGRGVSSPE